MKPNLSIRCQAICLLGGTPLGAYRGGVPKPAGRTGSGRTMDGFGSGDDAREQAAMTDVATVFGGSGFIGRYVVQRLARAGKTVRVAVRNTERALFLKTAGSIGQIVPLYAPVTNAADVHRAVEE